MNDLSPIVFPRPDFGIRDMLDANPVVGEIKAGGKRFWTTTEIAVMREHYPEGGINACVALLPGRTASSIYQRAGEMGLRKLNGAGKVTERRRYASSPQLDAAITKVFTGDVSLGAVKHLAQTLNRPRTWVSNRARALGLMVPRFKQLPWSEPELEILRQHGGKHPDTVRRMLKRAGFVRSSTAVTVKAKGLRIFKDADPDSFTQEGLAEAFGVSRETVGNWAERGWLKVRRALSHQAGAAARPRDNANWQIGRRAVRSFVIDNVSVIDFRKVDKFWLVDLLVDEALK